jgi:hypothetical protein
MKTMMDFVKERMLQLAKEDSGNAGGWEQVDDMAHLKLTVDYADYFILAMADVLKTMPYPKIGE